jgi:CIC family chloride channel protein
VILAEFETRAFSMIVVSSVLAAVVGRVFFGNHPAFRVPSYQFVSPFELLPYAVLGVLAGLLAVVFIRALYGMEDLWDRWTIPEYLKPVPGGLLMGVIGLLAYHFQAPSPAGASDSYLFGVGYNGIEPALFSRLAWQAMLLFLVLKLAAVSVTIASGGSGGVFSPSLFLGAMLGGVFGSGVHALFPTWTAEPGAYAMVGMGALFAGAAHAPITSVLILFEMTNNYTVILPLMLAVVIATLLAQRLSPNSIYLLKLVRRGVQARRPRTQDILDTIPVAEIMTTPVETVTTTMAIEDLAQQFERSGHHGFPVVDAAGKLAGIVTLSDVEQAMTNEVPATTVADVMTRQVVTTFADESVHQALARFGARDVGRIPVVDRQVPTRLVGLLRRADIVGAYGRAIATHRTTQTRVAHLQARDPAGARFIESHLAPDAGAAGVAVRDLGLPATAVLVSISRDGRTIIPRGDVQLLAGDQLLLLVSTGSEATVDAAMNRVAPVVAAPDLHAG